MSTQVSAYPLVQIPQPENRPQAKFHPNIWGDRFITYTPEEEVRRACKLKQVGDLKEEVRREFMAASGNPSELLIFIDTVQRLGVAYHFDREIEESLQHVYDRFHDADDTDDYLSNVALRFRLLRQQGYNISSDIFNKFNDENGNFKKDLIGNVRGMLGLYEAAYMRVQGEDILDGALAFTTTHLTFWLEHLEYPLEDQVAHALNRPLRKGLERLQARWYISIYQNETMHDRTLLKLSKLDFNLVLSLLKEELSIIARWWKGLDFAKKLPFAWDRLVEGYFWILGVYFEPQYVWARRIVTKIFAMTPIIDDMYDTYGTLEELELFTKAIERHIPTMEWYMRIALLSSGYSLVITSCFIGMEEVVTKEALDWAICDPKIVTASNLLARLMNDVTSYKFEQKRGHVASAIECYMKQYGVFEEQAYNEFHYQIENAWMDIKQECLKPIAIPMLLLNHVLNLSRILDAVYKEGDKYKHVGKVMKDNIRLMLVDPIV